MIRTHDGPVERVAASASVRMEGYFPNIALRTHENETVRFYDDMVKGKVVVISFMYTGCDHICPLTTGNLIDVQEILGDRVGRDVFLYGITLDPVLDTPKVLKDYARNVGAKRGFTFLLGHSRISSCCATNLASMTPTQSLTPTRASTAESSFMATRRLAGGQRSPA